MRLHRRRLRRRSVKAAGVRDYTRGTRLIKAITMTVIVQHMISQLLTHLFPHLRHLLYFIGITRVLLHKITEFAIMILRLLLMIPYAMTLHIMLKATRGTRS